MSYQERNFRIGSRFAGAMLSHLLSQKFIRSQQRDQEAHYTVSTLRTDGSA